MLAPGSILMAFRLTACPIRSSIYPMIQPGTVLGHYEVLAPLGKGGMGEVYRAKDQRLGREVAIKVLPGAFGDDPVRVARFDREARAAAALNHPNICAIHEVGEHEGQPFIVMELLKGHTLEARLSSHAPLEGDEVLELGTQLAEALGAAHAAGIVHRDIKPANIFITEHGPAKILDFGLAKTDRLNDAEALTISRDVAHLTGVGATLGTVAYMSPEQALGKELDPRTDLFSLGLVIYEALTGKPAFSGATSAAMFDQILNRAPTSPAQLNPKVAPELERIVNKLLEKDAALRYQHASELRADLKRMRRDTDSDHQQPATTRGAGRWSALRVTGTAAGGALALVVIVWLARSSVGPAPAETSVPTLTISPLTDSDGLSLSGSWSPDGTQVAYDHTLNGSMDVAVMSLGGGEPRLIAGGPNDEVMPRWSPDGSRIAFLADDGTGMNVYWVPPTGGARRRIGQTHLQYLDRFTSLSAIGSQPWSPDGRRLVFSRLEPTNSVALWTVDIESGAEARLTSPPPGANDWRGAWSHDGKWIAFNRFPANAPSVLYLVPASGGEPRAVLQDKTVARAAATWSLDDRHVLFVPAAAFGGDLSEVDISTGKIRQLTVGAKVSNPILSSTGRIVFSQWSHETFFFKVPVDNPASVHEQISLSAGSNFAQRFSPDGRQIVFQSARAGRSMLWLHDVETGMERQLTYPAAGREDRTPDWSPDGKQVVFLSNRDGPFQLWVADVDGGATHRLSEQAIPMDGDWWVNARVAPRWSSDGRAVAYLAPGERGSTLWLMKADGTNARPTKVSGVLRFDWYLDSRRAIYTRNGTDGRIEMIATSLDTGEEGLLLKANATELSVAPDGSSVAYNSADGHFSMNRYVLSLVRPINAKELPRSTGAPRQVTFGQGRWHVHGGAWSADGRSIVYTRDFDRGNLSVIDNYH